jgi:two-component system cell cycle sensor histidine kinase/response regulator CckA
MNLAINARDAMPRGGTLTIEVARISGEEAVRRCADADNTREYVLLSVRDSGVGMDEAVASRIFDPYFTTKEEGRGTGLGLSTVYGIVKQSGGVIGVVTQPGKGAQFSILLPHVDAPETVPASRPNTRRLDGSETVLLVEDQHSFRAMVKNVLETRGYRVLEAADPLVALRLAERYKGAIHLLLTDVVMPIMGGRELAEALSTMRAGIRVLYMSGYADDAALERRLREQGTALLSKPFLPDDLAIKVREVLDGG